MSATREIISSGNDLAAIAAVDAGCKFFGGYPITPSSEVMHTISDLLPKVGGTAIQVAAAIGAGMAGVRTLTATSGPGISLKAENLGLAQMAEVPLVVVNVMRGGPSTGLPTRVSQGDIARDPADYKPYGVAQDEPAVLNPMFEGYRYHFTGLHHDAMGFPTEEIETCRKLIDRLFRKVDEHRDEIESNEEYMLDDAEILLVGYGSASLAIKEAVNVLREQGIKAKNEWSSILTC